MTGGDAALAAGIIPPRYQADTLAELIGHRDNRQLLGRRLAPQALRSSQVLAHRDRTSHKHHITPTF